ncbi:MAG: Gfo/Idh/MocA family oxidoreductase [Pirellulaceae bacterium]|nr:Gfo/Idh/MocA family oxidoreductase [Pirellulaceae bacterium]
MHHSTRRRFLEDSMLATASAALAAQQLARPQLATAQESASQGASDMLRVAILGCGIRGKQHAHDLGEVPGCEIVYVCDPDIDRVHELASEVEKQQGTAPQAVRDMRRVFDDKSVDAVFIATPDHWHALAAIWAMESGKDAYVEKPVSHDIAEGRRIVETARKLDRICQTGTQNRSNGAYAAAVKYIQDGKLGEVTNARSIAYDQRNSIGGPGKYDVPASVDYNLFSGPAPMSPLTRPHFHYDWHWFWETGTGNLGNINIHSLDVCRWGLGISDISCDVICFGGRFGYSDAGQTPNTQVVAFDFGDKKIISETRGLKTPKYLSDYKCDWIFEGTNGFIANASLFDLDGKLVSTFSGDTENHFGNFLKAVRSRRREDLNADILEGHRSTSLCHLGNISYRLGQRVSPDELREELGKLRDVERVSKTFDSTLEHLRENKVDLDKTRLSLGPLLQFDSDREAFINHVEADTLLKREYRQPFVVPDTL